MRQIKAKSSAKLNFKINDQKPQRLQSQNEKSKKTPEFMLFEVEAA